MPEVMQGARQGLVKTSLETARSWAGAGGCWRTEEGLNVGGRAGLRHGPPRPWPCAQVHRGGSVSARSLGDPICPAGGAMLGQGQDGACPSLAAMGPARHKTAAVTVGKGMVDTSPRAITQPFRMHEGRPGLCTRRQACHCSPLCRPKRLSHQVPVSLSFQRNFKHF